MKHIDGIILRHIPLEHSSLMNIQHFDESKGDIVIKNHPTYGRDMVKRIEKNSMGGKWLCTVDTGQGSLVRFNIDKCGVGNSPDEAIEDFLNKKNSAKVSIQ